MDSMECGRFTGQVDPAGWWASEKFGGWRAHWTGTELLTRKGHPYKTVPSWFLAGLPSVPLDCELWAPARVGGLTHVQRAARAIDDSHWRDGKLQLMVFDAPSDAPFEARLGKLGDLLSQAHHAFPVVYSRLRDSGHLCSLLNAIERNGGEGVVITRPGSEYEVCGEGVRSDLRLKVKSYWDSEFRVVSHEFDERSTLDHLVCETQDGRTFKLRDGVSPAMYPDIGAVITIRAEGFTKYGVPQFGRLVAVRPPETQLTSELRCWSPVKA